MILILEKIEEELAAAYSDEDDIIVNQNDILASRGFIKVFICPFKVCIFLEKKIMKNFSDFDF